MVSWNNPDGERPVGVEHRSFPSRAAGREVGYNVSVPLEFAAAPDDRFPVLYFLHGAGGNENSDSEGFTRLALELMRAKRIPPIIVVCPNAGMSGYRDGTDVKGEALIVEELVPLIDRTLPTRPVPEARGVVGFSMGGGGAVRLALRHPDLFSVAASFGGGFASFAEEWNVERVTELPGRVRLRFVVGDADHTFEAHGPVFEALDAAGLSAEKVVLSGVEHMLRDYLKREGERTLLFLTERF